MARHDPERRRGYRRTRSKSARGDSRPRGFRSRRIWVLALGTAVAALGTILAIIVAESAQRTSDEPTGIQRAGAPIYATHCASCHGANLEGEPNWRKPLPDGAYPAPPHDASGHTWHHPDSQLFEITKFGGQAAAPSGFKSRMPAFGHVLSDAEIWAVLEFIKSRWPKRTREAQARLSRSGSDDQ